MAAKKPSRDKLNQNRDELIEKSVAKKFKRRDDKKKPKMKVSGKQVFKLAKLMRKRKD